MESFDLIVVGAGPGGYVLALDAARKGLSCALIEERPTLGGTCLNVGCIPSKALLESSQLFHRLQNDGTHHGIEATELSINLDAMMARKDEVVKRLTTGIDALMKKRQVEVIHGTGHLVEPGVVTVQSQQKRTLQAPKIVLATGSLPVEIPILPFDGKRIVDSTQALSFTKVPKRLAVVGGGAVGLELGSVWSRLGSQVTILEALDRIVPSADEDASKALSKSLQSQGITIRTGCRVLGSQVHSRGVKLALEEQEKKEELAVDCVLVAVGRIPNTASVLGTLDQQITMDGKKIAVNASMETSVPGIYAIGDLIHGPMLAHKAEEDALILSAHLSGETTPPWGGPLPAVVYTHPELAWVGSTEHELQKQGRPFKVAQFPFAANGRALAQGEHEGFVKLLSSPEDERLLGACILGPGASELIAEVVSVMAFGGCAEDIAFTVHAHPTLSETLREAALEQAGRPLHRG